VLLRERVGHASDNEITCWRQRADDSDADHVIACMKLRMIGKKFIVTHRGYVGLAPLVTKEQDRCAIMFRCTASCILRKTSKELHHHFFGATVLMGSQWLGADDGWISVKQMGDEQSKAKVEWDVKGQDIELCWATANQPLP
jgi:hypothetical protein